MLTEKQQQTAAATFAAEWAGRGYEKGDRAVMEAYGFPTSRDFTESDCVARLFEMYKQLTQ